MAKETPLQKVADFFGGVRRYDSKDHPESAPMMNARKDASQGPAKGPFKTGPATSSGSAKGMKVEKTMQPIKKQSVEKKMEPKTPVKGISTTPGLSITKTKAPRY